MPLYGNNLAKAIRSGTSWGQASEICGQTENSLRSCYSSLDLWNNWKAHGTVDTINLAILSAISPDDSANATDQIDQDLAGIYALDTTLQEQATASGWDSPAGEDYLEMLRGRVSVASSTIAYVDKLFHTSVLDELSNGIVDEAGNLSDKLANGVSKVLGNFLGGLWWVIVLGSIGLYAWYKWGRKAAA